MLLLAALTYAILQRTGPDLAVTNLSVTRSTNPRVGCDSTANITGVIQTNGSPGTITYQWIRSDGTVSGVLRETLSRGQKRVSVNQAWSFSGHGRYRATATLRILSPTARQVSTVFTYTCT